MSVKASELPDLIAAAVKKAVADKVITDDKLALMLKHPITIGIVAASEVERLAAPGATVVGTKTAVKTATGDAMRLKPPIRMGYYLDTLDVLKTPAKLRAESE